MERPLPSGQEPKVYVYRLSSRLLSGLLSFLGFGFAAFWWWSSRRVGGSWDGLLIGLLFGLWFLLDSFELHSELHLYQEKLVKLRPLGFAPSSTDLTEKIELKEFRPLIGTWGWMLKKACVSSGSKRMCFDSRLGNYEDLKKRLSATAGGLASSGGI